MILAVALLGLARIFLARRRLRERLGRYVSPESACAVERRPEELGGRSGREVSILFSDLRGFTTLSERMAPEQMAARLTSTSMP